MCAGKRGLIPGCVVLYLLRCVCLCACVCVCSCLCLCVPLCLYVFFLFVSLFVLGPVSPCCHVPVMRSQINNVFG